MNNNKGKRALTASSLPLESCSRSALCLCARVSQTLKLPEGRPAGSGESPHHLKAADIPGSFLREDPQSPTNPSYRDPGSDSSGQSREQWLKAQEGTVWSIRRKTPEGLELCECGSGAHLRCIQTRPENCLRDLVYLPLLLARDCMFHL